MKTKRALYALAVVVLSGSMAVDALAEFGGADSSFSAPPVRTVEQPDSGAIRRPMETGAILDRAEDSSYLYSDSADDERTVDVWGRKFRLGIDSP